MELSVTGPAAVAAAVARANMVAGVIILFDRSSHSGRLDDDNNHDYLAGLRAFPVL